MIELNSHVTAVLPHAPSPCVKLVAVRRVAGMDDVLLAAGEHIFGSHDACDVVLAIDGVEPQHCTLSINGGGISLTAISRKTWVNDGPVRTQKIVSGDRLVIGPVEFQVEVMPPGEHSPQPQRLPKPKPQLRHTASPSMGFDEFLAGVERDSHSSADVHADPSHSTAEIETTVLRAAEPVPRPPARRQGGGGGATTRAIQKAREVVAIQNAQHDQNNEVAADLDRRRAHMQMVLADVMTATTRALDERRRVEADLQRQRDALSRMHNDTLVWQAALHEHQSERDSRQTESDDQRQTLREEKLQLNLRWAELEQLSHEQAIAKRQQQEREATLQTRVHDLSTAEADLLDRHAEIHRAKTSVAARQIEIEERSAEIEQRLGDVKRLRDSLQDSARDWDAQRVRLERNLSELHGELADRDAELADLRESASNRDDGIALRESELAARTSDVEKQSADIERRADELVQRESALEADRTRLDDIRRTIDDERVSIAAASSTAAFEHESLRAERSELDTRRESLDQANAELEQAKDQFAEERRQLEQSVNELTETRKQCDQERAAFVKQQESVESSDRTAAAQLQELAEQRVRLEEREAELRERLAVIQCWRTDIETQRTECEVLEQQLFDREEQLNGRDKDISRTESELEGRLTQFADDERTFLQRNEELVKRTTAIGERAAELAEQEIQLRERELSLSSSAAINPDAAAYEATLEEIAESRAQLDRHREEFGAKQEDLLIERQKLSDEQQNVRQLRSTLTARQKQLEEERHDREQQFEVLDADYDQLLQKHAELIAQNDALRTALQQSDAQSSRTFVTASDQYEVTRGDTDDETATGEIADAETGEQEPVRAFRSQMAEMFGISATPSTPEAPPKADPADQIAINAAAETSSSLTVAAAKPLPDITESQPPANDDEPETVEAFMERLLALQRTPGEESTPSTSNATDTRVALESVNAASGQNRFGGITSSSYVSSSPRPKPEVERERLDSFRELANRSARTAVAKHNSANLKSVLATQLVITAVSVAASVVLLSSVYWSQKSFTVWGGITGTLAVLMIVKVLKTFYAMRNNHASANRSRQAEADVTNAGPNTAEAETSGSDSVTLSPDSHSADTAT